MGKIFCEEFERVPLKFHTIYLTRTSKDVIFIQCWNLRALRSDFRTPTHFLNAWASESSTNEFVNSAKLTHWGWGEMAAIQWMTFSKSISYMKIHVYFVLHYIEMCSQAWLKWHIYGSLGLGELTHWGRVTHICVGNLTTTGSDNGLSPGRRQAIIWTNAEILLIGPQGTKFGEILIEMCAIM